MRIPRIVAAGVAAALLASSPARADLIRLIDGRTVEGKVSRSGGKVTVKGFKGKSSSYAESEVKFTEAGECSWDVAARMVREIPADASDTLYIERHLQVARYLKERRPYCPDLVELESKEYDAVLKRAPENEESRVGLGHVKWGKWWFKSEREKDAFRKGALANVMEPLGYVKYKKTGMWELQEDVVALEAGKVKFKGRWMTPDEKKEADGYVKDEKGAWVLKRDVDDRKRKEEIAATLGTRKLGGKEEKDKPPTVTSSRHFRLISWFSTGETAQLKELAEKTYAAHRELLGIPLPKEEEGGDDLFSDPIDVFLLIDGLRKEWWIQTFAKNFGWNDELISHRMGEGAAGWVGLQPYPYLLLAGSKPEKNRERDTEHDFERARAQLASDVGIIVLDRIRGGVPAWMYEGNAFLAEIRMNETAECCHSTMTKYREEVAAKQGSKAKYYDFMKKQIGAGLDRTLRQLFTLDLNFLDWADSVKCWSFLEFLAANYQAEFRALVQAPIGDVDEILPAHVDAAIQARKFKDPAAAPADAPKEKDEGPIPTGPIQVRGAGAATITEGSKEARAVQGARSEAWLANIVKRDLDTLEKEWKAWILKHD